MTLHYIILTFYFTIVNCMLCYVYIDFHELGGIFCGPSAGILFFGVHGGGPQAPAEQC